MKFKLQSQAMAAIFLLVVSLSAAFAQNNMPPGTMPAIDPMTGLPVPVQAIDPGWTDPNIVLTNVVYDNIPLSEVADHLRAQFKDHFDMLLPVSGNWKNTPIQLRLKGVKTSEVFNAMNLVFENDGTPLRWELKLNGNRPTILLRVLVSQTFPQSAQMTNRMVYFVGDLIGDEKTGGMTMEQIVKTVSEISQMTDSAGGSVRFHKEAQLLIVTGTDEQINFMSQTIAALREKQKSAWRKQALGNPPGGISGGRSLNPKSAPTADQPAP